LAIVTDTLSSGLTFMDVQSVTLAPGITTSNTVGTGTTPTNVTIGDTGGGTGNLITFDFGTITNSSGSYQTITLRYRVVVLDVTENRMVLNGSGTVIGATLRNDVTWQWSTGQLEAAAQPVNVVEAELGIEKEDGHTIAIPGALITFTIDIAHTPDSRADAYDVVVTDLLPPGLEYIPGSLQNLSGIPGVLNATVPTLQVSWAEFPLGATSEISFQARFLGLGTRTNTSDVVWSSLRFDPGVQSIYNTRSTERSYVPGSSVDSYRAVASVALRIPNQPATGFAPGRLTDLPVQPADRRYQALGDMWLEIPVLNIQIPIVGVPLTSEGWDLTWLGDDAGYLDGTTFPTQVGTSGITGHVYLADGSPGPFVDLYKLYWGDKIILHAYGERYIYQVRETRLIWPDDLTVFRNDGYIWMTLLTCKDYNEKSDTYLHRVAVRAVLIGVEADPAQSKPVQDNRR
jgi:LPXTG-site transpeptidase (sortase) family protein